MRLPLLWAQLVRTCLALACLHAHCCRCCCPWCLQNSNIWVVDVSLMVVREPSSSNNQHQISLFDSLWCGSCFRARCRIEAACTKGLLSDLAACYQMSGVPQSTDFLGRLHCLLHTSLGSFYLACKFRSCSLRDHEGKHLQNMM